MWWRQLLSLSAAALSSPDRWVTWERWRCRTDSRAHVCGNNWQVNPRLPYYWETTADHKDVCMHWLMDWTVQVKPDPPSRAPSDAGWTPHESHTGVCFSHSPLSRFWWRRCRHFNTGAFNRNKTFSWPEFARQELRSKLRGTCKQISNMVRFVSDWA